MILHLLKSKGQGTATLKGHYMLEITKEDPKEPYKEFQQGTWLCKVIYIYIKYAGVFNEYVISVYDKNFVYPMLGHSVKD